MQVQAATSITSGPGAVAPYGGSVAIGDSALASSSGGKSVTIGNGTESSGNGSIAIGADSDFKTLASGVNAIAIGLSARSSVSGGVALGRDSSVTLNNSVALGAGSTATAVSATTANTTANAVVSGKTLTINQAPTNGVVAVGSRQIQGVADGALTATSTDAVNGAQLFQTATSLNANTNALGTATTTALGGGAAYNTTTGTFTAPLYSLAAGAFNNVGSALTAVDTQGSKYFKSNSFGSGSTAAGTDSIAIGPDASATQTNTIAMGNAAKATGTDAIAIGAGALATGSIAAGVSTKAGGGGAAFGDYADAGGTAQSTSTTVTKGTALGHYAVVETNDGVALGSRSVAATAAGVMGYDPATNASSTVTSSTWNSTLGAVSVGGSGDTRQITNLAAGTADTDAVNLAQLKALDTEFENVADRAVLYDGALGSPKDTLTLAGANSMDGGVTNGTRVTSLSAGMLSATSTDAVNGSQLFSTNTNLFNLKACTPLEASWTALNFSCCNKFLIEARIRGAATSALGIMGSTIGSVSAAKLKGEVRQTHL